MKSHVRKAFVAALYANDRKAKVAAAVAFLLKILLTAQMPESSSESGVGTSSWPGQTPEHIGIGIFCATMTRSLMLPRIDAPHLKKCF